MELATCLERESSGDSLILQAGIIEKIKEKRSLPKTTKKETIKDIWLEIKQICPELTIGTSSLRRIAFLKKKFPSWKFVSIRGNLGTRIAKMNKGEVDGLVLASAALSRIDFDGMTFPFEPSYLPPAPAQGILAVECRKADREIVKLLRSINHRDTELIARAERKAMHLMGVGCRQPFSALAKKRDDIGKLDLAIFSVKRSRIVRSTVTDYITNKKEADLLAGKAARRLKYKMRKR